MSVIFVSMPFGPHEMPALGLSLLQASLKRADVASSVKYYNIGFSKLIGAKAYAEISLSASESLIGEWVFAEAAFDGAMALDAFRHVVGRYDDDMWEYVRAARACAATFLESCVDDIVDANPRMVGLTSTFQQNVASLALARRIKARNPDIVTVMGGANCEGPMGMELKRQFPFVDAVVSGEAERAILDLVRGVLAHGRPPDDIPGVFTVGNLDAIASTTERVESMDDLPMPSFTEFFATYDAAYERTPEAPRLLFESSRGCWWGQKNHCTFCGLNGSTMVFRSKSTERALRELDYLAGSYPGRPISAVDNILDMKYFEEFVPTLAARKAPYQLFYETKANLKKTQVRLLREAGITTIQPGIESLDTDVLRLMRKGVSMLQNVQLLKFAREHYVLAQWNLLWGFPGETAESYRRTAELVPKLHHLTCPSGMAEIRLDRFSPNFDDSAALGFRNVRPFPAYGAVYPLDAKPLANLAYYFAFDRDAARADLSYGYDAFHRVEAWKNRNGTCELFSIDVRGRTHVFDNRASAERPEVVRLSEFHGRVLAACDSIRTFRELTQELSDHTIDEIASALHELEAGNLVISEHARYLALPLPVDFYRPPAWAKEQFVDALREQRVRVLHSEHHAIAV